MGVALHSNWTSLFASVAPKFSLAPAPSTKACDVFVMRACKHASCYIKGVETGLVAQAHGLLCFLHESCRGQVRQYKLFVQSSSKVRSSIADFPSKCR